jgi:hypothetical protein
MRYCRETLLIAVYNFYFLYYQRHCEARSDVAIQKTNPVETSHITSLHARFMHRLPQSARFEKLVYFCNYFNLFD